jgi:DNA-binding beta-propeller fold protein YncE
VVVGLGLLALAGAPAGGAGPGSLVFAGAHHESGVGGARGVKVSPDGKNVYVAGQNDNAIAEYTRDPSTGGALTYLGCIKDETSTATCGATTDGLSSARFIAISADGKFVYVTGGADNAVAVLSRNTSTGALSFASCVQDTTSSGTCTAVGPGGSGILAGAEGIATSPDAASSQVYVAGQNNGTVATLNRNASTGALTFAACASNAALNGCATDTGALDHPRELAVALDGKSVYVASASSNAIAEFSRDTATGALTAVGKSATVNLPVGITVSTDVKHVYVGNVNDNDVAIFSRDATTSALTFAGCVQNTGATTGCATSTPGLGGTEGVATSPDGANIYATGMSSNAVVAFSRNSSTGALTPLGCLSNPAAGGCAPADGMTAPRGIAVSPDNANVYVAGFGDNAVLVFGHAAGGGGGGGAGPPIVVSSQKVNKHGSIVFNLNAPSAGTYTATATFTAKAKGASARTGRAAAVVTYGTGTATATAAGPVSLTIKPTKAGRAALRKRRHLSVSVHLAFRSSAILGSTVSSKDLRVKVRRRKH